MGMEMSGIGSFNIGPRLTLVFALLIVLILGGNGLVLWQFQMTRLQVERLTAGNQQVIAALQLDRNLLLFYHRLDELVGSEDADRIVAEAEPLSKNLIEEIEQTKDTISHLPPDTHVDPAFLATLDAIETDLPTEVNTFTALAKLGEWELVRIRLANGMRVYENQISSLVKSIDQQSSEELKNAVANMKSGQRRIDLVVPITAILTVFIATFFGWAVTRRMLELRMEERVNERTRLARELHDTLLQSFQAAVFQFQAARRLLLRHADNAMLVVDEAVQIAEEGISEGREAIRELRPEPVVHRNFPELLNAMGRELAKTQGPKAHSPSFGVTVEGKERDLALLAQDEVFMIAREIIRNAFHHADANLIEVEIRYDEDKLRLRIRDDGKGIDRKVLESGGQPGHWGIPGMRERAQRIGSQLQFWSEMGAGTEVELTIPASMAYERPHKDRRFRLFPS